MSYASFAQYYDSLTHNVEYARRADYLCTLLAHLGHAPGLTLDLACGTGSLTVELAKRGMDIYGIDGSADMLSVARQKAAESGLDLLFLCQKMQKLDLYGTVDTVICALDSINHLTLEKDVQTAFDRVSLFMNPGGWFLFDVNTVYKLSLIHIYDLHGDGGQHGCIFAGGGRQRQAPCAAQQRYYDPSAERWRPGASDRYSDSYEPYPTDQKAPEPHPF